jgi:predicted nucleic acid-binding protein
MQHSPNTAVSSLTRVEATSAFTRREAEGLLSMGDLALVLARLELVLQHLGQVPLSENVLSTAERLVPTHGLRTLDAIQLASALSLVQSAHAEDILFIAADRRLLAAATQSGLKIWNPVDEVPIP